MGKVENHCSKQFSPKTLKWHSAIKACCSNGSELGRHRGWQWGTNLSVGTWKETLKMVIMFLKKQLKKALPPAKQVFIAFNSLNKI